MDNATRPSRPRPTSYVFSSCSNNSNGEKRSKSHNSSNRADSSSGTDSGNHADSATGGPRNVNWEKDSRREILIRTRQAPQPLQGVMRDMIRCMTESIGTTT